MKINRRRQALGASLLALATHALATQAHAAGGAYAVDNAAIGNPGDCQVESWVAAGSSGHVIGVTQPACVVNLGVPVEFTTTLQGVRLDGVSSTLIGLRGKFILLPMGDVAVALTAGTFLDARHGESATLVNVPVTIKLRDDFRLNLNGGWLYDTVENTSHVTWGGGFEWDFQPQWTLIGEVYGQTGARNDPRAQVGLRFAPTKTIDLDLIYGHDIIGDGSASWVTAGLTVRFPH
ncbi:MAG: hypothetical protein K2X43_10335 [Hyphomonadaceae bacterium]|jgi:hypothetical protein|nr:hypothetical protein [Hyphomonadaceae bacterium]